MDIRKATENDLAQILPIYSAARQFMRQSGNMEQWAGNYPAESDLRADIAVGRLYVCVQENSIAAVFCFFVGEEPTYGYIEGGAWQGDGPYGVIHRIAVAPDWHRKGVADACYAWCLSRCGDVRIDTHRDNLPMQRSLAKNGFNYRGIIYLADGAERLAFQKHGKI